MARTRPRHEGLADSEPRPLRRPPRLVSTGLFPFFALAAGVALLLFGAGALGAQECTECHDTLSEKAVHADFGCTDCHEGMTEYPHEAGELSPSCGVCHDGVAEATGRGVHADFFEGECSSCHGEAHEVIADEQFRLGVDDLCGECHDDARSAVLASAHQNVSQGMAPVCSDCHGAHGVLRADDPDSPTYHLNVEITCSRCHGNDDLMLQADLDTVAPAYHDSIHGFAVEKSGLLVAPTCVTCHGAHDILPKENPESRTARDNIMAGCAECHVGVFRTFYDSIHAEVNRAEGGAPICIDCHSAHGIQTANTEDWILGVVQECGTCHEDLYDTYRRDFHGQVTAIGYERAAKCSDCHGAHDIVRVADAESPVGEERLISTCRECHPNADESYAQYNPHPDPSNREDKPLFYTTKFMQFLLAGVFAFFGLHTLLWLPRSWQERRRREREHAEAEAGEAKPESKENA